MDKHTNVIPGDKAIVVSHSNEANVGIICDVVRPYVPGERLDGQPYPYLTDSSKPMWVVESLGRKFKLHRIGTGDEVHHQVVAQDDRGLRPLRNSDGEDQVVSRVGRAPESKNNHEIRRRQPEKTT